MATVGPNWAEQVTAIATAVLALGVFGAAAAAVFGAQQVRDARRANQAQMAADFFRRWNENSLVEARRLVASFDTPGALASAFQHYVAQNLPEAYVLYRELDYFEQLAALESAGAIDFALLQQMIGRTIIERWETWQPALRATHGEHAYPLFGQLATRMRQQLNGSAVSGEKPAGPPVGK